MNTTDLKWKDIWLEKKLESSWISETVDQNLERYFLNLNDFPLKVLEVGCGDGINSLFLSDQGCQVEAIDISEFPLSIAKLTSNNIKFICDDFLTTSELVEKYNLIFDKGCFHGTTDPESFIKKISSLLATNGVWFSIIGSAEGRTDDDMSGPPKHKLSDLINQIEPYLKIVNIESTTLIHKKNIQSPAWKIISTNRE